MHGACGARGLTPSATPEVNACTNFVPQHAANSCKLPEIRHPPPLVLAERPERRSVLQFVIPQDDDTCIMDGDIST